MTLPTREDANRAYRPDAQAFDEIRIITVPRWKTSGLSGDEWRISASVIFYRSGREVHREEGYRNVEAACNFMGYFHAKARDDGHAFFAGEGDWCDQEGCSEKATVVLKMKQRFCREGFPHKIISTRLGVGIPTVRCFCEKHKTRGDCGLDDADTNYEPVP